MATINTVFGVKLLGGDAETYRVCALYGNARTPLGVRNISNNNYPKGTFNNYVFSEGGG